ncbi:conserved Plasmodium protein, unknown function [Plasmodium gallinaceum]|uniref:Importin N-terminal domain-containing protein n=1 Tax=Plasmodium gallinaceum TaxID=5849 RepID=A0A1J1GUB1_PLAGA|nr:conserved Plasmodium protein, unknown function [Plasmodium gallinaceum]CRG95827.1 conserved Plasmodium protein, unknown function [Plasmodium gallinaceum]
MEIEEKYKKIIDALYDTWSNDHERRKESEQILNNLEKDENFIMSLLIICSYTNVHYNIRKLAIILSKNLIVRYWNCRDQFHFNNDIKKLVKNKIIEILNRVDNLNNYREFCILLKKIARYELVHNYPELLECLLYNINIHKNNMNSLYIYIYLLYKIIREQCSKKLLKDKKETFNISEKFINSLEPFWNNCINLYFQNNIEFCICSDESNCTNCNKLHILINDYEKKMFTSGDNMEDKCSMNNNECYEINEKKIKILKYVDSILLNLIINRNDIIKGINNDNNNNNSNENNNDIDINLRSNFFNSLINKTIYYLKFINKGSSIYYLKYLKFLLTCFLLMIEFHNAFHTYLKKDITEKFICLFLKKNLNINNYINDYENKFVEIVNLCISILKSIFYHFCLNQYNLIKQKKVRENYINVKNMMCNKNVNIDCYNENTLESKIINNLMTNVKNVENDNKILFNKNLSLKEILTYIRGEVKQALSSDDFILIHNQKALEIFDFLRIYCINISSEQIIDVILNIKDDFETEENIFYNNAKDCIVQLSSEPFLFSIFNHLFEPLINSFHNYAHFLKNFPNNLKSIQVAEYSEAIIHLDGYLNIYYILYPSFHKKIKVEHILCIIQFFLDYLSIKYTHPLISYRIALIIKIWLKSYKVSFPFIDDITLLIYENIRFLYMQLLEKNVISLISDKGSYSNDLNFQHFALKSSNFLPILFFKFICLFKYIFKYEYIYKNYDYINEFLVGSLINILTKISYPKNIQKILKILSHIVFMSNKEKDITLFKDNYNFLLDLYMSSNLCIKEYILNILVQILNKNYEYTGSLIEFMNKENYNNDNNIQSNDKLCDDIILFYFSFDIISYTMSAKIEKHIYQENQSNGNYSLINFQYIKEINLDIDKTIDDNFYSLWLCILKLISKKFSQKNDEIIKKICSLYVVTINFLNDYFKKVKTGIHIYEISNFCFDIVMEYFCLFIIHETHDLYLTYEAISAKMLTNDILKHNILSIIENNFIINDEIKIEKCIYILHVCLGIYKDDIKSEMPVLYTYIANFVTIYLIKVLLKYFNKYFNFYKFIQDNQNNNSNDPYNNNPSINDNIIRDERNKIGDINYDSYNMYNNNEEINNIFINYNKSHINYIYNNVINYHHDEKFIKEFANFQKDVKILLNINYLNNYDIAKTFKSFNFYTVNADNFSYINKHSIFTLISILSLYENNFLNFILICFFSYFKINVSLFISSFIYQSHYIHNKNILTSLLIFICILTQNYVFVDFSSVFTPKNFPNIVCSKSFENLIYDKNRMVNLFICSKDEKILLIIELLKLINNILNTNKDIYIEKKNILHLSTMSSNLGGSKIFHSYNYNYILRNILNYNNFPNICNKALDNILTYLVDINELEENNKKKLIVNYLKENIDDMNSAIVDMYKKYMNFL